MEANDIGQKPLAVFPMCGETSSWLAVLGAGSIGYLFTFY